MDSPDFLFVGRLFKIIMVLRFVMPQHQIYSLISLIYSQV